MSQIDGRTPTELMEIDAEDDNALRVIVVVPWELPGRWEQWRRLFAQARYRSPEEWAGPFSTGHLAGCASR